MTVTVPSLTKIPSLVTSPVAFMTAPDKMLNVPALLLVTPPALINRVPVDCANTALLVSPPAVIVIPTLLVQEELVPIVKPPDVITKLEALFETAPVLADTVTPLEAVIEALLLIVLVPAPLNCKMLKVSLLMATLCGVEPANANVPVL